MRYARFRPRRWRRPFLIGRPIGRHIIGIGCSGFILFLMLLLFLALFLGRAIS